MAAKSKKEAYPVIEHKSSTDEEVIEYLSKTSAPSEPPPLVVGAQTLKLLNDLMEREYGKAEEPKQSWRRRNVSKLPPGVRRGTKKHS